MPEILTLREMTEEEGRTLRALAHSRTTEARLLDRARMCWLPSEGQRVAAIKAELGVADGTVRRWMTPLQRAWAWTGLRDRRRAGRPATYPPEAVGELVAASLTDPQELGLPFGSWTLDRLAAYLHEEQGHRHASAAASGRSCRPRAYAGGSRRPGSASGPIPPSPQKGGHRHPLHRPARGQRRDLPGRDGAGKRQEFPRPAPGASDPSGAAAARATQEIDYGRRGRGLRLRGLRAGHRRPPDRALSAGAPPPTGSISWSTSRPGSIRPSTRVYAVLDNLSAHRAPDVLLWALAHPRWEFVFQPTNTPPTST